MFLYSFSKPLLFVKRAGRRPPEHFARNGERGVKMKKILWLLSLAVVLLPTFASADCVDLERFTNWILETSHTLVFYAGAKPLARLEIPNCEITPLSTIRLRTSYVCEEDEIIIDGVACHIITVQKLF